MLNETEKMRKVWEEMINRCHRESSQRYPYYGARGIMVEDRWRKSFERFLKDMGPRPSPYHSLERIDNNGNYERGNVKWGTRKEQMRNTRRSKRVTYMGQTKTLAEWCEVLNLNYKKVFLRLNCGLPPERAFLPDNLPEVKSKEIMEAVIKVVDRKMSPAEAVEKLEGVIARRAVHRYLKGAVSRGLLLRICHGVYAPLDYQPQLSDDDLI